MHLVSPFSFAEAIKNGFCAHTRVICDPELLERKILIRFLSLWRNSVHVAFATILRGLLQVTLKQVISSKDAVIFFFSLCENISRILSSFYSSSFLSLVEDTMNPAYWHVVNVPNDLIRNLIKGLTQTNQVLEMQQASKGNSPPDSHVFVRIHRAKYFPSLLLVSWESIIDQYWEYSVLTFRRFELSDLKKTVWINGYNVSSVPHLHILPRHSCYSAAMALATVKLRSQTLSFNPISAKEYYGTVTLC